MDWGLAKVWTEDGSSIDLSEGMEPIEGNRPVQSITDEQQLQGSILYMSPEQTNRDPDIDFRTDIYSLGAILYEVLAGQPPFDEDIVQDMLNKIRHEIPPPPSDVTSVRIPELLEKIAMKCLAKSPDERITSCAELVRLLEEDW